MKCKLKLLVSVNVDSADEKSQRENIGFDAFSAILFIYLVMQYVSDISGSSSFLFF